MTLLLDKNDVIITSPPEKHQFNLSYEQKNQLAAYYRQSTLGPYHQDKLNPGYFDFVGNDRKSVIL